jgi:hypothetical protein
VPHKNPRIFSYHNGKCVLREEDMAGFRIDLRASKQELERDTVANAAVRARGVLGVGNVQDLVRAEEIED